MPTVVSGSLSGVLPTEGESARRAAGLFRAPASAPGDVSSRRLLCLPVRALRWAGGMEENMEEEEMLTYEAMMDDQNHNNWEAAADGFRQPPPPPSSSIPDPGRQSPGGQLLAVPAVSVDRKGPKEGLPMGPPPLQEPNGVIMMLKSCDAAAAVAKAVPAPTPSSTININTSTSKFRESGLSP